MDRVSRDATDLIEPARSRVRAFLFADLRDYTAFAERAGNEAAAELLARYRAIVRGEIARHRGAEIRTEGDSFYVVCESAGDAVRIGLGILAAAEIENGRGSPPIRVGIGVHAGETADTDEGFVGVAVNIAARVASQAGASELLVTETVRELVRGSSAVRFEPVGRRRLKGVNGTVALHRAMPTASVPTTRVRSPSPRSNRTFAVAAAAALAVVAIAAAAVARVPLAGSTAGSSAPLASPTAALSVAPSGPVVVALSAGAAGGEGNVALAPGRYRMSEYRPTTSFSVQDGWAATYDSLDAFQLTRRAPPAGELSVSQVRVVYADGCPGSEETLSDDRHALVDWLVEHELVAATPPRPVNIGSFRGVATDVAWRTAAAPECSGGAERLFLWPIGSTDYWIAPEKVTRVVSLETESGDVVIAYASTTAEFEQFAPLAEGVTSTLTVDE